MNADSLNSAADFLTLVQRTLRAAEQAGQSQKGRALLNEANALVDGHGFLLLPEHAQIDVLEQMAGAKFAVTGAWA